jgi:hypothetical protein
MMKLKSSAATHEPQPRVIVDWSIRSDPYKAPEVRGLYIYGRTPDNGKQIATSRVVEKISPMIYRTKSGSLYRLEGPPEPMYANYCKENNIPLDLEDPIKLKKTEATSP